MSLRKRLRLFAVPAILAALWFGQGQAPALGQTKKALTFLDMMKFKIAQDPVISDNGLYVAYTAQPDRGDGETRIRGIRDAEEFIIERGIRPQFAKNSLWLAALVKVKAAELESRKKDKPKQGMALLDLAAGKIISFEKVERFSFSEDSEWLAYLNLKEEEKKSEVPAGEARPAAESAKPKLKEVGATLVLRRLASGKETKISFVSAFAFDGTSKFLAYAVFDPEGKENGLYLRDLSNEDLPAAALAKAERGNFTGLVWSKDGAGLAFLSGTFDGQGRASASSVWTWEAKTGKAARSVAAEAAPQGWVIPSKNSLTWSQDGRRLFFGFQPKEFFDLAREADQEQEGLPADPVEAGLLDSGAILAKREVDIWHWNDPLINPHQKKDWDEIRDRTYLAVFHLDSAKTVPLASGEMRTVEVPDNPVFALGLADTPYLKEITWDGNFNDVYGVDLMTGAAKKIVTRLDGRPSLSPDGRFLAYYQDRHWRLVDMKSGAARNLTEKLNVPFFREEHDTPDSPPGYGLAGWVEADSAVLIYDRYDIWKFPTGPGEPVNLTAGEGRKTGLTFRLVRTDPEARSLKNDQKLLLSAYHNKKKHQGFYAARVNAAGVSRRLEEDKRLAFLAAAKTADSILFTRESYTEYPDLWVASSDFSDPVKVSDLGAQTREFAWGTAELVEWNSLDGLPLQGVLIKPGNYDPGKRYPVLVYFYELSSQRLYEFNQVVVNHRPCFPLYASNGYALFLPDVVFDVGHPGPSAVKCIIPGVQKLIDMGVADPKGVALHGHSWSGYQTAYVVTQSNIFCAAIAGAAVSNMTSAYNGIRWESGLARQFQYEKTQSRIGGSLWERPELYLENSPVFFADRIRTPLLLEFGDEDGAVPWYQGIELYLAMRRLGKDCIFLQYRGEPHHPQKYPNKLDYAMKMKQYLDHHCKGETAADWIKTGAPYRGK